MCSFVRVIEKTSTNDVVLEPTVIHIQDKTLSIPLKDKAFLRICYVPKDPLHSDPDNPMPGCAYCLLLDEEI
ncbi:hypothetical protein NQ318_001264 [Aromia moschata]|uniref:Uncharacterized protein n=1 Tax=Aromia moschata TaxID=1265417 RepID=A0AAV8ZF11_9CUCU|nr:hypothetical protein NQ318_001264 [Aromia moschata]